jgi:hypothetical protein
VSKNTTPTKWENPHVVTEYYTLNSKKKDQNHNIELMSSKNELTFNKGNDSRLSHFEEKGNNANQRESLNIH